MKKYYIFFILITFCVSLLLFSDNINLNQTSNSLNNLDANPNINISTYSDIGSPLNVTEYANRTDASQSVTLYYNATSSSTTGGSAYAILPPSWQSNLISVDINNIYENRCWNLNPEFNGPTYSGISKNISKVFVYDNNLTGAISLERDEDKILYMAFIFGKVTNGTNDYNQNSTQDAILNRTLNWMGIAPGADILLIKNDYSVEYSTYFRNSLIRLGYPAPAETTSTSPVFNSVIRDRDLIIWSAGDNFLIESGGASDVPDRLIQYLDQTLNYEQNLIVEGQYVGYSLDDGQGLTGNNQPDVAAQNFYKNYLRANFLDFGANTNISVGLQDNIIGHDLQILLNGTGAPPQQDIILSRYNNNESQINDWTSNEFGNDYSDDWYYRREIHGHGFNDSAALLHLEDKALNGYDTGDKVWLEQTVYINRSEVLWAGLNFDYWAFNSFGEYTGSFKILVQINNTQVYSKAFSDIIPFTRWLNTGMVPISIAPFALPGALSIKIGLEVTSSLRYTPDINPTIMLDNFKLYLKTKVAPANINLKMDGKSVSGGLGYGNVTYTPASPWETSPVRVNFTWNPSPAPNPNLDIHVSFLCDTNLFASKTSQTLFAADPSKIGTLFEGDQGNNISWSFQYYVSMPNGYWNHSFIINHPADWTITFVSEPQFPVINKKDRCILGQTNITIPSTIITNSPNAYWRFEAKSPNYNKDIQPQIYNGTQWINSNVYFITNCTRLTAYITNNTGPPPNLSSSSINLTITNPNNQLWYTSTDAIYLNGWALFPNLTIFGVNTTAGLYQVSVAWNNGLGAGYRKSNFTIVHNSQMILSKPTDAVVDRIAEVNYGELLLIRVGLNDTNRNELIKGVNLTLNWTQSGSPTQLSLNDLDTGQYEVVLDTTDLPSIDNYTIVIKSYSSFFNNASFTLTLIVTAETLLSSPQYPKIITQWGQNITLQIDYLSAIGEIGLNNSLVLVNWTLGPHSVFEIGNGRYDIEINLSYAGIREYCLIINATRPNCAFKTLKMLLEVIAIQTELTSDSFPKIISEWNGSNITIQVDFHTLSFQGVNSSIVTVNWTQFYYQISEVGNGLYNIELNTSWCQIRNYVLQITTSKAYYQNRTLAIIIQIDRVETSLSSPQYPKEIAFWGDFITLQLDYLRASDGTGINNGTIFVNWTLGPYNINPLGNGRYEIRLNLSYADLLEYTLNINASKLNYKSKILTIKVDVNPIETELLSSNYPSITTIWNQNITINLNYRTISALGINTSIISNNWTLSQSIIESGNGIYLIEINTSMGALGKYAISISSSKPFHQNRTLRILVEIKAIETELISANYPRVSITWSANATIQVNYRTIGLVGIDFALITINWTGGYYAISPLGNGLYSLKLNTSWTILGEYLVVISALKPFQQNRTLQIIVEINAIATELISDSYPRVLIAWNENATIIANFRTVGLVGVDNALITVNWTGGYYAISPLGSGLYSLKLNSSWAGLGAYWVVISASKPFHQNRTLQIIVEIDAIETEFISDSYPRVSIVWNENATILANFRTVGLVGVDNALVTVNWTGGYYVIDPLGNGLYSLKLNSSWAELGDYWIVISASKLFHQNRTLTIILGINSILTDLTSDDYPRVIEGWNINRTIVVNYKTALGVPITKALILANWSAGLFSISESGSGNYKIIINTSAFYIGVYKLQINASKQFYENRTLRFTVEITAAETELTSDMYPRINVEWSRNATIDIRYFKTADLLGIESATITLNWTIGASSITSIGIGTYRITLNTSSTNIQQYMLEINASKPYHEGRTIRIKIIIDFMETSLSYKPIDTISHGQNGTIFLKFTDLGGIPLIVDTLSVNATYWVSYNPIDAYPYKLIISTAVLQETDLLNISVVKLNHRPQNLIVAFSYRAIFTSLITSNQSLITLPVEESVLLFLYYNNTDQNLGIEGANFTFNGYSGLVSQDLGGGYYSITVTAGTEIDAYTVLITAKASGHFEKTLQFVIQVKQWLDFATSTVSAELFERQIGDSAYFFVVLQNEFTGTFFEPEDIILSYTWGLETGGLSYNGNGNYSLILNTVGKAPGPHTIIVNATTKDGHLLMHRSITMVITTEPPSWFESNSWIFGVVGALCAIVAGYGFRNKWRERKWEKKVKHLYILTKTGIPLYDKRLGGVTTTDASLVTSALIGISSIVQEIVQSKRALKTIDHMDNKILFQYGFQVITAVLSSADLPIIRRRLAQVTIRFEDRFKKELENWKGDIDVFFGANKIINEFFPIEEYLKDQEISIEWILERLFEMFGLSGVVTLLTIDLGLKIPEQIAAGTGIDSKKVPIIIRTLQDLLLIDAETNLTPRGKKAIAIYKDRKEKYMKIQRLTTREVDITKKDKKK